MRTRRRPSVSTTSSARNFVHASPVRTQVSRTNAQYRRMTVRLNMRSSPGNRWSPGVAETSVTTPRVLCNLVMRTVRCKSRARLSDNAILAPETPITMSGSRAFYFKRQMDRPSTSVTYLSHNAHYTWYWPRHVRYAVHLHTIYVSGVAYSSLMFRICGAIISCGFVSVCRTVNIWLNYLRAIQIFTVVFGDFFQ